MAIQKLTFKKDYALALVDIQTTVNQLVDAVNELTSCVGQLGVEFTEPNPADPYAEQRKWIGKLCKFWDYEDEGYIYEILIDIKDDGSDYPYKLVETNCHNWTISYKHCKPVSEDLIYKGGNNE